MAAAAATLCIQNFSNDGQNSEEHEPNCKYPPPLNLTLQNALTWELSISLIWGFCLRGQ